MKNARKFTLKVLSLILSVALIAGIVPVAGAAVAEEKLNFGVISDIHYYPEEYSDFSTEFGDWAMQVNKQYINQRGIINSALAIYEAEAEKGNLDFIIVPGDLTMNGEYLGHVRIAEILENFERRTGVQVIVANGNHDINNSKAYSYIDGENVKTTTPEDFREIYKNLGFDIATSYFTPPEGEKAGMLSYSVVSDGYRIIVIDGGKYSSDNTEDRENEHETGGNYSPELVKWVLSQCKEARKNGETIIGVDHWSLVPHYESQDRILQGFTLDNWLQVGETFADAGMHYVFTGHSHSNDVSQHINDNGEVLWDIQTSALIEFPHYCRTVSFTNYADGSVGMDYNNHEVDEVLPVAVRDTNEAYPEPYRKTFSFNYAFKGDIAEYAKALVKPLIKNLFADIAKNGGLAKYLDNALGLEALIEGYLGSLTPNAMAFIEDLGAQIDERYINNPEYTLSVLNGIIDELCEMPVSELPSMGLYDEYGVGNRNEKGTFGDVIFTIMIGMWQGDENFSDPFLSDVVDKFENGDLGEQVFNKLKELVVDKLLKDEILSNLYVNIGTLLKPTDLNQFSDLVQGTFSAIILLTNIGADVDFDGKTSYLELANGVLKILDKTDVLEGGSVDGVLDHLIGEYITESQYEAWGHTFAYLITDFGSDNDPVYKGDSRGNLTYSSKLPVPVSEENYRLPALISVTLGNDSESEMNISWYSKYSLDKADIEIVPYSENPVFKGISNYPKDLKVELTTQSKVREFPGVDLGIIGFFPYEVQLQRHIAKISGMKPGEKYLFRVGNAEYGWWSETGVLKTADGSDEVTFLHITDTQGQNEKQYGDVADVIDTAMAMYDDTDLIIHSGDVTDYGSNLNYWRYFFSSTDNLIKTPLMPVSGNHEEMGDTPALLDNFVLPDSVEQDVNTGYYYSFDYNNVHFIMLNTNDTTDDGLNSEQLEWLKKDASSSKARWKIVVLHKAVYSNGSHFDDGEIEAMRNQFASLMPELGIDMVFQGHDHVYLRTDAMKANEIVQVEISENTYKETVYETKVDPDGTVYAITGAAGCKNYIAKSASETDEAFPRAETVINTDSPVFAGVRIDGDMLYYDAYTVNNGEAERIDSFAIKNTLIKGDTDGDGKVTIQDARKILLVASGIESIASQELEVFDVDNDKRVTTKDARLVLSKAAGLESY